MTDTQPAALAADHPEQPLDMVGRWYMVNEMGMATLCSDKDGAEKEAADAQMAWPHMGPHRAVQLVEVASIAASTGSEPVAHLWQHCETGRTRIVMPDMIVGADASWQVVGPLYLGAAPPTAQAEWWRLVPVEPTAEMLRAGDQKTWVLPALECWRAMLAAAPNPPAQATDSVQDLQPVHDAVTIDLLNERVAYLERKLQEADSVLEDAARYRWLRERMLGIDFDWNESGITALSFEMPDGCAYGGCCNQNIDAARAAQEGKSHGRDA